MTLLYNHPYWCKLWYPHSVDYADATYSVSIKAPELGNKEVRGRNQVFARTKSGNTVVADFGINLSTNLNLEFKAIPDAERSALIVFLSNVNWGKVKLMYEDQLGLQRVVRINSNVLDAADTGLRHRSDEDSLLWDFNLDLIDISDNLNEQDGTLVPTALALHLADYDHPHNPKFNSSVALETKVLESLDTTDWVAVTWYVKAILGAKYKHFIVHAINDGVNVDFIVESLGEIGAVSSELSLSVDVSGGLIRLKATSTVAGPYVLEGRRIKL